MSSPFVRLGIAVAIILMIFSMPVREFLKLTFMLGIPFVLLLGLMVRRRVYSPVWIICLLGLIAVTGGYFYMLTDLPERIETRRIVSEGAVLVAEGKYDQAIALYQRLDKIERADKMHEKIAEAQKEKDAAILLNEARVLLQKGIKEEAIKKIKSIPEDTRAYREANKVLKEFED